MDPKDKYPLPDWMDGQEQRMQASEKVESCRIGEAANPGPGLHDKQHKQLKMGELFIRSQTHTLTQHRSGVKLLVIRSITSKGMDIASTHVWGNNLR
eukprot:1831463-Heterocapsa_arctica.AAC.1